VEISVNKDDRLDRFLRSLNLSPWLSKRAWEELLLKGAIRVNGKVIKKPGHSIHPSNLITLDLPELGILLDARPASLIAEKNGLYFFDKPVGISTYPLLPWETGTFANQIAAYFSQHGILSKEEFENLGEPPILEGGLLQRLDRDTSGILACVIDKKQKEKFRQEFSGEITKTYWALASFADLNDGDYKIYFPSLEGKIVKASTSSSSDKFSSLKIKILCKAGDFAWIEVETKEGFRHVIRAGMAALGCPLVGDGSYGGIALAKHHMLHALSLKIPTLGEFSASVPQSFLDCAKQLGLNR
jgi:23S rRNA pseudouridine1911/1915/1917 synthase